MKDRWLIIRRKDKEYKFILIAPIMREISRMERKMVKEKWFSVTGLIIQENSKKTTLMVKESTDGMMGNIISGSGNIIGCRGRD